MKKHIVSVTVAGTNISAALSPVLLDLSVTDKAGATSDTASITVDDRDGQIIFPKIRAEVTIALGWSGGTVRQVFSGYVDGVKSSCSRSGGRTLSITAKGADAASKIKQGQQRHFDDKTVEDILKAAGEAAGVSQIDVDPDLASEVITYLDMRDESFIHLGQRLARMVGGSFRVQGQKATMAKRAKVYEASITAAAGDNLHSWDITPAIGRGTYKAARARAYDPDAAEVVEEEAETETADGEATIARREFEADIDAAYQACKADAAAATEAAGGGSITIEGDPNAVPDGLVVLSGARPGVNGTYRIKQVTHNVSRSSGYVTTLEVAQPQGEAGTDSRA